MSVAVTFAALKQIVILSFLFISLEHNKGKESLHAGKKIKKNKITFQLSHQVSNHSKLLLVTLGPDQLVAVLGMHKGFFPTHSPLQWLSCLGPAYGRAQQH